MPPKKSNNTCHQTSCRLQQYVSYKDKLAGGVPIQHRTFRDVHPLVLTIFTGLGNRRYQVVPQLPSPTMSLYFAYKIFIRCLHQTGFFPFFLVDVHEVGALCVTVYPHPHGAAKDSL